jgi:hypothetical protein
LDLIDSAQPDAFRADSDGIEWATIIGSLLLSGEALQCATLYLSSDLFPSVDGNFPGNFAQRKKRKDWGQMESSAKANAETKNSSEDSDFPKRFEAILLMRSGRNWSSIAVNRGSHRICFDRSLTDCVSSISMSRALFACFQ